MQRVAAIGECMIELSEHPDGRITRAFGGDTLNTAVYLARLGVAVDYVTALGDDGWSEGMVRAWAAEGVGTERVIRVAGRMPGLYIIQTDARGERTFSYWRSAAPARDLFTLAETESLCAALERYDWVYLSGISLSLYGADGRARLFATLDRLKANGGRVAFDTNFRARGWPVLAEAREAYADTLRRADLIFASLEDLAGLKLDVAAGLLAPFGSSEIVLKLDAPACEVHVGGGTTRVAAVPVATVVDTTAAGDSFAAGYLAARIMGRNPPEAATIAHRLAGAVVLHRGAIIPKSAMPGGLLERKDRTT